MKYFTKLLSMLLVGVMLSVTSCTDYDQDIKDLNNKVDALEKELVEGQINPLKADLAATKAALESAIADANAKIAENQEAIEALKEVDKQHSAAIADAQEAIADAIEAIGDLEDKHDSDIEAVNAKIAKANEAINKANEAIDAAVARISDNEEAIDALEAKDVELAQGIADALLAIKANADAIAANKEAISDLSADLLDLSGQFTAYKAEMAAAIATLESRLETAEAAIEVLEGNVEELYELHDIQGQLIENLDGRLEDLAAYTEAELEALRNADLALNELIVNLDSRFEKFKGVVKENFEVAFGQIAANTAAINALEAKHDEEIKSLQAQDAAILETLELYRGWLAELDENIEELYELHDNQNVLIQGLDTRIEELAAYTQEQIDALNAAIKDLNKKIDQLQIDLESQIARVDEHVAKALAAALQAAANAEDSAKAYTDALAKSVEASLGKLAEQLDQLNTYAVSIEEALNEYKDANDNALKGLRGDMEELYETLLNRVQSIVFVPEYTDGKGTINYAKAGETLVEARSTMVYQVYPAECAAAIAKSEEAVLSYNLEGLKTRAAEGPQFNIVAVEGTEDGRLIVTFDARNLGAEFYAGQKEYAASLVLDSETANLSTVYTNVVPVKTPEQITMNIVNGEEVISGRVGETYEFEYTDTETVEKVLPEHVVVFDVDGTSYEGIEALNNAGYAVALERAMYFDRYQANLGHRPFAIEENEDGIYEIKVEEINGTLIANPVDVGYTYTAGTLKAEAYVRYSTSPVKADVIYEGVSASWIYSQDALVDAAKTGAYARGFNMIDPSHNLPEDVTIDMVFADAPKSIKVYDGEEVAADVVAEILVKEKTALQLKNFAWGKSYVVKAVYEVKDKVLGDVCAVATVTIPVTTVDRNREPIVINLDPSTIDFKANVESFNEISDNLDVVYETLVFGNEEHYDIASNKWLEKNFGPNGWTATEIVVADGKEVTLPSGYNTYLAIGADNGKTVYTNFSYADFDFVPAQVEYTKTVTTWYGQEVVINKVLNFEFPVYDFKHNSKYVYGADADFYSQVQPEYTWKNDNEDEGLLKFDVAKVILRAAFDVVDANGKKLTPAEQAALSLKYNFTIEDEEHVGIDINAADELSYYGANPYVNVRGNLYIVHNNGAKYTVPTSFDEGGKYETYNVVKFNPIGTAEVIKNPTINVNNAIAYNVHVLDYVKLDDHRMGGRQNWPLITNGAWVAGNDLNGFAQGVDVRADYMYRINEVWVNDTSDVDEEIRPYITLNNGTLTFDNSQQLELTAPFTVPVTLKFQNCWMEKPQQVTVKVTFNPIK